MPLRQPRPSPSRRRSASPVMLACQLASAAAVVWGIRVRKGVVRYETGHEDENPMAGHSSWAEQDRLLNPRRAGQDLPCCGVLAPVRCGGWDCLRLLRCRELQLQATPLVQADAPSLGAYPELLSQRCSGWNSGCGCAALQSLQLVLIRRTVVHSAASGRSTVFLLCTGGAACPSW